MLAFTQAHHKVLTENIANIDTPEYAAKHLDPGAFQQELRNALDVGKENPDDGFQLGSSDQFRLDEHGQLEVTPGREPAQNILFHDKTNVRIEEQMADLAENAMMHQLTTELLLGRFEGLTKAIRGRMT